MGLRINLFTLKHFDVWIHVNLESLENVSSAFALICDHLNLHRIKPIHAYISCNKAIKEQYKIIITATFQQVIQNLCSLYFQMSHSFYWMGLVGEVRDGVMLKDEPGALLHIH